MEVSDSIAEVLLQLTPFCVIETFLAFPEVVTLPNGTRISKEAFTALLNEGWIVLKGYDSFGGFYKLTDKAKDWMAANSGSRV